MNDKLAILIKKDKFKEVLSVLKEERMKDPHNVWTLTQMANAHWNLKQYDAA